MQLRGRGKQVIDAAEISTVSMTSHELVIARVRLAYRPGSIGTAFSDFSSPTRHRRGGCSCARTVHFGGKLALGRRAVLFSDRSY